ncbi:MAG TPA: DUF1634 domain-containing protein [Thermomicrobiales bacterium]|nr:DUF1634 domain-containing protein [Thermomicrobiales bacterium]
MSSTTPDTTHGEHRHHVQQATLIGDTIRVYEWGFYISLALIVVGIIVGFVRGETMPDSLGSPGHVYREFIHGHADGIVGVGVLVMILTPLVGVLALAVNFFRARDRQFGLLTTLIVLILIGSVAFSYI